VPSIADPFRMRSGAELVASNVWDVSRVQAAHVASSVLNWWLHIDLAVLSTEALSALDYQQPGGLTWDQLEELTSAVLSVPGCFGTIVVTCNPDLDQGRAVSRIADYVALLRREP